MEADGTPPLRRSSRERATNGSEEISRLTSAQRGLKAAQSVLNGELSHAAAAREFGLQERMVSYYREKLVAQGYASNTPASRSKTPDAPDSGSISSRQSKKADVWDDYCDAYMLAGQLCSTIGKRAASQDPLLPWGAKASPELHLEGKAPGSPLARKRAWYERRGNMKSKRHGT